MKLIRNVAPLSAVNHFIFDFQKIVPCGDIFLRLVSTGAKNRDFLL